MGCPVSKEYLITKPITDDNMIRIIRAISENEIGSNGWPKTVPEILKEYSNFNETFSEKQIIEILEKCNQHRDILEVVWLLLTRVSIETPINADNLYKTVFEKNSISRSTKENARILLDTFSKTYRNRKLSVISKFEADDTINFKCLICYDGAREVIVEPCGHLIYCRKCLPDTTFRCPICNTNGYGRIIYV